MSSSPQLEPQPAAPASELPDQPGFWQGRRVRTQKRRTEKEARLLVGEVRSGLGRHGTRLSETVQKKLAYDAAALEKALESGDELGVRRGIAALDDDADRHLAFARKSTLREYAESIGIAVLFALFLRAFVVEAFKIPSGSMIPTLEVGDHIFVNKYIYGIRIPWTKQKFFEWRRPHRGEVVVFMFPQNPETDFIKRVVAVAGDTLEVRNNQLVINGVPQKRDQVASDGCRYTDWNKDTREWLYDLRCVLYRETLGDHVFYTMDSPTPKDHSKRNFGPETVPDNMVYVMGDNRDDSHDSRYWGGVPLENIKGKALIVWWSLGWKYHWGRIGKMIY